MKTRIKKRIKSLLKFLIKHHYIQAYNDHLKDLNRYKALHLFDFGFEDRSTYLVNKDKCWCGTAMEKLNINNC